MKHGQCLVLLPCPVMLLCIKATRGAFHHLPWGPGSLLPWCWDSVDTGCLCRCLSDRQTFGVVVQPPVTQKLQSPLETAKGLV